MAFCGQGMEFAHGIGWCSKASRFLTNGCGGILTANADWSRVYTHTGDPEGALALAAICARFAEFDCLLLHGALVAHQGEGILFTGPSGIGKTTQAKLWQENGSEIINGDKVLVRSIDGRFYGCGLPWKGSSPYCLNRSVPLKAVVALGQSGENRIRPLDGAEPMAYVVPHIFLPVWDEDCHLRALETVDRLLTRVPMHLLQCRPDTDAVTVTKKTIFDGK